MRKKLIILIIVLLQFSISASLIAHYNFEDGFSDISGHQMHGTKTIEGSAETIQDNSAPEGSNYLFANGIDGFLDCGSNSILEIEGPLSISFWMNADVGAPYSFALSKHGSYRINVNNGWVSFQIDGISGAPELSTTYTAATWQHITAVYDKQDMKIYVNGVLKNSKPETRSITKVNSKLSIGAMFYGALPFKGKIDDVRIYNHALSEGDVWRLKNKVSLNTEYLVGYWNFNNGPGDFYEKSGNGGVISGFTLKRNDISDYLPTITNDPERGNVLELNGQNYLQIDSQQKFNITNAITLAAWVKPDGLFNTFDYGSIISKKVSWRLEEGGQACFYLDGVNGGQILNGGINLKGSWHHVAAVYDKVAQTKSIYIDGVKVITHYNMTGDIQIDNNAPVTIGSRNGEDGSFFKGKLDDIRVYNSPLSDEEINNLAKKQTYFVAAEGFDCNDGKTPETAFRTQIKIRTITFNPGDSVLFRNGDTFVGYMGFSGNDNNDDENNPIYVGPYLDREPKPLLKGSINLNQPEDWEKYDDDQYQTPNHSVFRSTRKYKAGEAHGFGHIALVTFGGDTNIVNREWYGKAALRDPFTEPGQHKFWFPYREEESADSSYIYLKIAKDIVNPVINPATSFQDIECASLGGITFDKNTEINRLKLQFVKGHALSNPTDLKAENVLIRNCDISYVGGNVHRSIRNEISIQPINENKPDIRGEEYHGRESKAAYFDGSTYLNYGDDARFDLHHNMLSISVWVKPDGNNTEFNYSSIVSGAPSWTLDEGGFPCFALAGVNNGASTMVGTNIKGQWHHIVAVYNGPERSKSIYIDGVLEREEIFNESTPCSILFKDNYNLTIGSNFSGYIDDAKLYSHALSSENVSSLYNNDNLNLLAHTLFGYWDFEGDKPFKDKANDVWVSYGNGVEFFGEVENCHVMNCKIHDVFDAGVSPQGGGNKGFANTEQNISFRNNLIWNADISFEFWLENGGILKDIFFENNTCYNAGGGWGKIDRLMKNGNNQTWGCHVKLLNSSGNSPSFENVNIRNNIFYESRKEGIFFVHHTKDDFSNNSSFNFSNNYWYKSDISDPLFSFDDGNPNTVGIYNTFSIQDLKPNPGNYYNFTDFQSETGQSSNSILGDGTNIFKNNFKIPLNLHLGGESIGIDNGSNNVSQIVNIFNYEYGNKDIDGETRINNVVDIGADEKH